MSGASDIVARFRGQDGHRRLYRIILEVECLQRRAGTIFSFAKKVISARWGCVRPDLGDSLPNLPCVDQFVGQNCDASDRLKLAGFGRCRSDFGQIRATFDHTRHVSVESRLIWGMCWRRSTKLGRCRSYLGWVKTNVARRTRARFCKFGADLGQNTFDQLRASFGQHWVGCDEIHADFANVCRLACCVRPCQLTAL